MLATNQPVQQGHFILYDANLEVDAGQLVLTIGQDGASSGSGSGSGSGSVAGRINPTAKAFLEGRASVVASTSQGADMVSESAMHAARMSTSGCHGGVTAHACNAGVFMGSSMDSSRYQTGSHMDVRDVNLALGIANRLYVRESSAVTLGAFVEHAQGRYDTYNDFGSWGQVRGHGDMDYRGVGC